MKEIASPTLNVISLSEVKAANILAFQSKVSDEKSVLGARGNKIFWAHGRTGHYCSEGFLTLEELVAASHDYGKVYVFDNFPEFAHWISN